MDHDSDFLHGAEQFAEFLGVSRRRAFYMLERGHIPAAKRGNIWTGRKSRIIADQEAREAARNAAKAA